MYIFLPILQQSGHGFMSGFLLSRGFVPHEGCVRTRGLGKTWLLLKEPLAKPLT